MHIGPVGNLQVGQRYRTKVATLPLDQLSEVLDAVPSTVYGWGREDGRGKV